MLNKIFIPVTMVICLLCINNCSVAMVRDVKEKGIKLSQDHVDWKQEELEKYYGSPIATTIHEDGSKTCIYEFKKLYASQNTETGENLLIVTDVLTLGIGEMFWVPLVQYAKIKANIDAPTIRSWVTYDSECKVRIENNIQKEE